MMRNLKLILAVILCTAIQSIYAATPLEPASITSNTQPATTTQSPLTAEQQAAVLTDMSKAKAFQDSAMSNKQAQEALMVMQGITAAADALAQATGKYAGMVNNENIAPLLPTNSLKSPWGSEMNISNQTAYSYTVTIPNTPQGVCKIIQAKVINNQHYKANNRCDSESPSDFIYIYNVS